MRLCRVSRRLRCSLHVFSRAVSGSCFSLSDVASASHYRTQRIALWNELVSARRQPASDSNGEAERTVRVVVGGEEHRVEVSEQLSLWEALGRVRRVQLGDVLGMRLLSSGKLADVRSAVGEVAEGGDVELEVVQWGGQVHAAVEAQELLWHSSAHLLGDSLERFYDRILLRDGPALVAGSGTGDRVREGFYYEFFTQQRVAHEHYEELQRMMLEVAGSKRKFEWLSMSAEEGREMFSYNPFKLRVIEGAAERGEAITAYRCGDFIDLCRGPHVPTSGRVKYVELTASSSVKSEESAHLHRIYGISFPSVALGEKWAQQRREAQSRDHRKIGKQQRLWMFHPWSAGNAFLLPDGMHIYQKLFDVVKRQYKKRGFREVMTPQLFDKRLWQTSGHWDLYREDMFFTHTEEGSGGGADDANDGHNCNGNDGDIADNTESQLALKPMNCPAHCLMFANEARSERELPIRFADCGVLHRNELKGALTGLTRLRKFQQDDAHIFCTEQQLGGELRSALDFVAEVYEKLGFPQYSVKLSTRPQRYIGDLALWERAERELRDALDGAGVAWEESPGDGAFYGPKVDVEVADALDRQHQCGTIQLDFQMPRRFELRYQGQDRGLHTPVMIHRAILGSGERMLAIMAEHHAGRWPFWINPKQVSIIPLQGDEHAEYAHRLKQELRERDVMADVEDGGATLNKKIRNAQVAQYNFILVIGDKEVQSDVLAVRNRDGTQGKTERVDKREFLERLSKMM